MRSLETGRQRYTSVIMRSKPLANVENSADVAHSRFDMMGKRVYKQYERLSNIILRVSDGTREGKQHALLLNSHVDSTVPSPGLLSVLRHRDDC